MLLEHLSFSINFVEQCQVIELVFRTLLCRECIEMEFSLVIVSDLVITVLTDIIPVFV